MIKRVFTPLVSACVACAIVSSEFALTAPQEIAAPKAARPPEQAPPPSKAPESRPPRVKVYKSAPRPKASAAVSAKRLAEKKQARQMAEDQVREQLQFARMAVAVNRAGQVPQMLMQFRPIIRAEFHVIRVACRPTPAQRKAIAEAAEQTLRDATRKYVEAMNRPMTMAQRAANDPRRLIEQGLAEVLKSRLPAEQAARYQAELTRRAAARKRAALRNLVARLDHDLILSPDQRAKISESLAVHWDDSWGQSIEMFMNDNHYLPPIPDRDVAPILNEAQMKVWSSLPKYQGFFGGFGIMGGVMMMNDPLEDEELREARLAAEAKDPQPAPMVEIAPMKVQMKTRVIEKKVERIK